MGWGFCPAVKENVEIMFKDSYGRKITYMRISVTDRCNLRCIYCLPADGIRQTTHKEILTFDEIVRIARIGAGKGISRIKITVGEPLVRKNIAALIRMLKAVPGKMCIRDRHMDIRRVKSCTKSLQNIIKHIIKVSLTFIHRR